MGAIQSCAGRQVVVIGICGASGSGKGTFAQLLATQLKTSYVLCTDKWFKPFDGVRSFELPDAVDFELFLQEVKRLRQAIETAPPGVYPAHECTLPQDGLFADPDEPVILPPTCLPEKGDGPVFIILEGFKLFADQEITKYCDHLIWLEADEDTCARRRAKRIANRCSVPQYKKHVWPAHVLWQQKMQDLAFAHPCKFLRLENGDATALELLVQRVGQRLKARLQLNEIADNTDISYWDLSTDSPNRRSFGLHVDLLDGTIIAMDDNIPAHVLRRLSDQEHAVTEVTEGDRIRTVNGTPNLKGIFSPLA